MPANAINSKAVGLLDHPRLVTQLTSLERTTVRGGRDKVDHPRGLHDDVANACNEIFSARPSTSALEACLARLPATTA